MTASQSGDPSGFRTFEHAGWQKIPKQYHESFSDLTPQAIPPLLDAIGVSKGVRLLDVASGPGYATAAAVGRGATGFVILKTLDAAWYRQFSGAMQIARGGRSILIIRNAPMP